MRIRSLRFRLVLAVGTVVLLAVTAVGWVGSRMAKVEFQHFLELEESGPDPVDELTELAGQFTGRGWSEVEGRLRAWQEKQKGRAAVVLGDDDEVLAASDPELREFRYRSSPDELAFSRRLEGESEDGTEEFLLRLPHAKVDGGRLYILPLPGDPRHDPGGLFLRAVNRWLLAAVVAAGLLALAVAAAVARRLLGPVEELTAATEDLRAGDLSRRVGVRGDDEVGRLASAFNDMAAALERNEELRRNMVSDTAHELRTPLTNLRCQLEALEDGLLAPETATFSSLTEEVAHLESLVGDLQELALAEAGQLRLDPQPLDLAEEAARAADQRRRPYAAAIDVEIGELPPVRADRQRLHQVLTNLLDNALAHAGGRVRLTARLRDGEVEVRISDDGPGIAPEHLAHVFERFYRTDPSRQRATGGAGLGLAIVRQLVKAQGGEVWVESPPEEGATFAFTLPWASEGDRSDG